MTVNFETLRKTNPTIRCNGWAKKVTGLDKSVSNGYSIKGEFVNKSKGELKYMDGVYLDCSKPRGQKNYHIFKVEDGEATVLQALEDADRTWATQLWDTIDSALATVDTSEEAQAQRLANLVLEQCNNKGLLNQVARILSHNHEGDKFFKNRRMVEGFLDYHRCMELPFARRHSNGEFWEHDGEWSRRNTLAYESLLEEGYTEHQAFFKIVIEDRFDVTIDDIKNGDVELEVKVINEFELQEEYQFHYSVPYYYFYGEHFGDAPYGIKQFDIRNYMIVGRSKGNEWFKPKIYVKLFSDKLWKDYLGEYTISP